MALLQGCASGSGNASTLQYAELLGPWEMGEVGREFTTGTALFMEGQRVLVQCGTVGRRPVAEPPRDVTQRGRGWSFRGCEGEIIVRRDGEGRVSAQLQYIERRPYTAQGQCTEWVSMDSGRRCVQWDQEIRYRDERRTRPIVLRRPEA
ncbi:MAG: hypothetical protein JSU98_02220 [Gemmatimonadales bacterium]|nr:MAG: hypothetical protein JSU98_02220 [Gemmatimonadales bacterium]